MKAIGEVFPDTEATQNSKNTVETKIFSSIMKTFNNKKSKEEAVNVKAVKRNKITSTVVFGDSLSDAGTMANRKLFGIIPMDSLAGLKDRVPKGRFSDRYVWRDHFAISLIERMIFDELAKEKSNEQIAQITPNELQAFIEQKTTEQQFVSDFAESLLNDDKKVMFKGQPLIRSYAEGGLTAHSHGFHPLIPARSFVSTLEQKREECFKDDAILGISKQQKAETLVIEWTGANDLITVNTDLTIDEDSSSTEEGRARLDNIAKQAVAARRKNIEVLIAKGYSNFALFNLPDLGRTPRYAGKEGAKGATYATKKFNELLKKACEDLIRDNPNISLEQLDINTEFNEIYDHCETYDFAPNLRNQTQQDLSDPKNAWHNFQCMFNDDVHPCSRLQDLLTKKAMAKLDARFDFQKPERLEPTTEELLENFKKLSKERVLEDRHGFFGSFTRSSGIGDELHLTIKDILNHALFKGGARSRQIIQELGWIDDYNNINPAYKEVFNAYDKNWKKADQNYTPTEIAEMGFTIVSLGLYMLLNDLVTTEKEMTASDYGKAAAVGTGFIITAPLLLALSPIIFAAILAFNLMSNTDDKKENDVSSDEMDAENWRTSDVEKKIPKDDPSDNKNWRTSDVKQKIPKDDPSDNKIWRTPK